MNSDEKNLKIISKTLAPTAECLIQSNVKIPISIQGVATMQIRDSKKDFWRTGYVVFYVHHNLKKQAEINKNLYEALSLVFLTLNDLEDEVLQNSLIDDAAFRVVDKLTNNLKKTNELLKELKTAAANWNPPPQANVLNPKIEDEDKTIW